MAEVSCSVVTGGQASGHGCCKPRAQSCQQRPDAEWQNQDGFDQIFQALPANLSAVELDHLKPVRPGLHQWLPSLSIERNAFDVAAAPFVDDRHTIPSDLVRIEQGLPMLRAVNQRVADQQAEDAFRLLLAGKLRLSLPETQRC